jgi:RHS repeat-associated protein
MKKPRNNPLVLAAIADRRSEPNQTSEVRLIAHSNPGLLAGAGYGRYRLCSSGPALPLLYLKQSGDATLSGNRNHRVQYTGLDRFGRIIDQRWRKTSDSTDRERVKYGFDRASNRVWRENTVASGGQNEFYTNDGLYQVKSLARGTTFTEASGQRTGISSPVWEEDWNYDPTGNWRGRSTAYLTKVSGSTTLNQNRSHNKANEITGISTAFGTSWPNPTHDAAGNMTKVPRPLSLDLSYDLKWDAWNRLVEVKNTGGSVVAAYGYDGAHRRVTKLTGSTTRHFYYSDQWQVLEERLNTATTADRRFVWGTRHIDDLILRDRGSERLYVLHDAMSVTAVINTSGAVQERYGYDGFGSVRYMTSAFGSRSSSDYEWETLFGAYRYDQESGLYQVRYRYLHSGLGRWVSRDPIGYIGGLNLFAYTTNRSLTLNDGLGLICPSGYTSYGVFWMTIMILTGVGTITGTETTSETQTYVDPVGRVQLECRTCTQQVRCNVNLRQETQGLYEFCQKPATSINPFPSTVLVPLGQTRTLPPEQLGEPFGCVPVGPRSCSDWTPCCIVVV